MILNFLLRSGNINTVCSADDDADETVYATEDMADENVDDRCESDISGVATDDTDLSTVSNIGDICLANCRAVRSYRHQPNPSVNAKLTYTAFIALIFACGIGIGHYMGLSSHFIFSCSVKNCMYNLCTLFHFPTSISIGFP